MKKVLVAILFCSIANIAVAQFAPPAGQLGSTAVHKDSNIIVAWASTASLQRGLRDISDSNFGYVNFGDSTMPTGKADGSGVASLGDGGSATLQFHTPIINGPGADFAVFENSFVDTFLELAFVEVSSDGINFHRFAATSNTQTHVQVNAFGGLDASKIHNLAGKYIANYGTPFDLEELKNINGLDINHITHVKIIDVVGSINTAYARYDKNNQIINDPWRTGFATGGFDLDAVGVIHTWPTAITAISKKDLPLKVYPNPTNHGALQIEFITDNSSDVAIALYDYLGRTFYQKSTSSLKGLNRVKLDVADIPKGNYILHLSTSELLLSEKVFLQ